jgi:YHS domain-containing protein
MTLSPRRLLVAGSALLSAGFAIIADPSLAGNSVNTGYFGGVAIMGYDPVAYFTEGRAVRGVPDHAYSWLGTTWHFATPDHKELFARDPTKYAPQYGGYCSLGVAYDGKLYLSYSVAGGVEWEQRFAEYRAAAEAKWPGIRARLEGEPSRE